MDARHVLKIALGLAATAGLTLSLLPVASVSAQAAPAPAVSVAQAAAPKYKFKNCTALQKVYKHGVGKSTARDKTSGKPVTTFKKSTSLYKKVIGYNKGLDRDKDGIACEKR